MPRHRKTPSLTHHKASRQAVVRIDGKDHYLGPYGSPRAQAAYHRLIAEWIASDGSGGAFFDGPCVTIAQLVAEYLAHAMRHYRRADGGVTSEVAAIRSAVDPLVELYHDCRVDDFGPLKLKVVRQAMIDRGLARKTINKHVSRLKALCAWGGENERIDPIVHHRLQCVRGLRKFRGGRETVPVRPVAWKSVRAVKPFVSRQVWAMVQLQWLTGMRPGEVVILRSLDVETSGDVWTYRPHGYKTEHLEHLPARSVAIGRRGQAVLRPWLRAGLTEYVFSPAEAEGQRLAQLRASRATPLWPSHVRRYARQRRRRPRTAPGERYTVETYRRAILRACDRAFPPPRSVRGSADKLSDDALAELTAWRKAHRWTPHRLRHTFATRVRRTFDLDSARAALGHTDANVTLDYAELDLRAAAEVARRIG